MHLWLLQAAYMGVHWVELPIKCLGLPAIAPILIAQRAPIHKSAQDLIFFILDQVDAPLADSFHMPDNIVQAPTYPLKILWQESGACVQLA